MMSDSGINSRVTLVDGLSNLNRQEVIDHDMREWHCIVEACSVLNGKLGISDIGKEKENLTQ